MEKICIIATSDRRILAVALATNIPGLLGQNARIEGEWFYKLPNGINDFFKANPDQLEYFLKGFSNWIESRVKGYAEDENHYGKLKRAIHEFSKDLFKRLRGLASRIAKQVRKILKPKRAIYYEQRIQKKMYRQLTSYSYRIGTIVKALEFEGFTRRRKQSLHSWERYVSWSVNIKNISMKKTNKIKKVIEEARKQLPEVHFNLPMTTVGRKTKTAKQKKTSLQKKKTLCRKHGTDRK